MELSLYRFFHLLRYRHAGIFPSAPADRFGSHDSSVDGGTLRAVESAIHLCFRGIDRSRHSGISAVPSGFEHMLGFRPDTVLHQGFIVGRHRAYESGVPDGFLQRIRVSAIPRPKPRRFATRPASPSGNDRRETA